MNTLTDYQNMTRTERLKGVDIAWRITKTD